MPILHCKETFSPSGSAVKNLPAMQETWARDTGSIPGSGIVHSNQLQYSYLENSTDRGDWKAWDCNESDTTEHIHTHTHTIINKN